MRGLTLFVRLSTVALLAMLLWDVRRHKEVLAKAGRLREASRIALRSWEAEGGNLRPEPTRLPMPV